MRIGCFYFVLIADCYFDALPGSNTPFCQVSLLFLICVIDCAEHCVYIGLGTINCILGGRVVVGSAFYEIFWWLCLFFIHISNASYVVDFFSGSFFGSLSARFLVVICSHLPVKILHLFNNACNIKIWGNELFPLFINYLHEVHYAKG